MFQSLKQFIRPKRLSARCHKPGDHNSYPHHRQNLNSYPHSMLCYDSMQLPRIYSLR